jgi:16S rRNA (cytosine967-C5)-methyltransferase
VGLLGGRERGFVNAILRRIAADQPSPPPGSSIDAVSMRTGLVPWAVRELQRVLGDEAEAAAAALGETGRLCVRANTCRVDVGALRQALETGGRRADPSAIDPACLLVDGGDPTGFPGYEEGWFAVQDHASAFVVRAMDPQPGERILDACAGPGGKAGYAACLVGPRGRVTAADVRPRRAARVRSAASRLGLETLVLAQDATRPALRGPFDRALVDAPCSGIGSARRRPELLWRPRRDQLSALARLQVRIVAATAELLRPGGTLVYSVCTFPRAETDAACDAIVRHRPDLEPIETIGPDGPALRVRLWPHRHGCDGMFVARFRRRR